MLRPGIKYYTIKVSGGSASKQNSKERKKEKKNARHDSQIKPKSVAPDLAKTVLNIPARDHTFRRPSSPAAEVQVHRDNSSLEGREWRETRSGCACGGGKRNMRDVM